MHADDRIKHLASRRMLYTGEGQAHAIADLRANPDRLLPVISGERARFDASIMEQLVRAGGFYWAHPFGIKGVWYEPGKTIVALDHCAVMGNNEPRLMGDFTLRHLLPYLQPDIEVSGVVGLRLGPIGGKGRKDLHLRQAGGPGHVVLRASKKTNWGQILNSVERDTCEMGFRPLWKERSLTADEVAQEAQMPLAVAIWNDVAWIGSALMQRINLFYSVSTAYTTSSWVNGYRWIVEMEALHVAGHPHNSFLKHLTSRDWGLDLRMVSSDCRCLNQDPARDSECRYEFGDAGNRRGILQLRFRRRRQRGQNHRAAYECVGADKDWLDRILPPDREAQPGNVRRLAGLPMSESGE
ncbi:hypothetical protein AB0H63_03520 [Micromonospora echinospora]|uniref:hypothetical protein n=1 Tax=Micromonospora echinospora TaxID=1877 RepID=UPI003407CA36